MAKTKAAGVFLINKDGKLLIGHVTNHGPMSWSIPKGKIDAGETAIQAAMRELREEANVDIRGYQKIHALPTQNYRNGKKDLTAFVLFETENKFDFSSFDLKCTSMVPAEKGDFPEIDDFRYVTLDEARGLVHMTQVASFDIIEEKFKSIK